MQTKCMPADAPHHLFFQPSKMIPTAAVAARHSLLLLCPAATQNCSQNNNKSEARAHKNRPTHPCRHLRAMMQAPAPVAPQGNTQAPAPTGPLPWKAPHTVSHPAKTQSLPSPSKAPSAPVLLSAPRTASHPAAVCPPCCSLHTQNKNVAPRLEKTSQAKLLSGRKTDTHKCCQQPLTIAHCCCYCHNRSTACCVQKRRLAACKNKTQYTYRQRHHAPLGRSRCQCTTNSLSGAAPPPATIYDGPTAQAHDTQGIQRPHKAACITGRAL